MKETTPEKEMKTTNVRTVFGTGSGYALGVTIPKYIYEELGWEKGERVVLKVENDKLIVERDEPARHTN